MSSHEQINWSRKSLEELQKLWNVDIESTLLRSGHDLDTRPTYQDLLDVGYGGIQYVLREHYDMTLSEFLETVGYIEPPSEDGYPWGIDDETTIDALESFIWRLEKRKERAETTVNSKRARLATYVRLYRDVYQRANVVDRVMDDSNRYDELERVETVLDDLDDELGSDTSKLRYLSDIRQFYDHLSSRQGAAFNPAKAVDHADKWETETKDNAALSSDQVRRIYAATESPSKETLVLALCAWGLRRSEVAELHVSQLVLEGEDPHIAFDDTRKNGPGRSR